MAEKQPYQTGRKRLTPLLRIFLEVGFIIFLFYSNLLMGEFTHSGLGQSHGLLWAARDIFTITNFMIAVIAGFIGHFVFGFFRDKL